MTSLFSHLQIVNSVRKAYNLDMLLRGILDGITGATRCAIEIRDHPVAVIHHPYIHGECNDHRGHGSQVVRARDANVITD